MGVNAIALTVIY